MPPVQSISISALTSVMICPLRYYYDRHEPVPDSGRYVICKQISFHGLESMSIEEIWKEILYINPDIELTLKAYLAECITACSHTPFSPYTDTDVLVHSHKYGFFGVADKINVNDQWIAITRAALAPDNGCYRSDRIRIAALKTAAEETLEISFRGGYVEYIPSGIIRWCEPGSRDRREVLKSLQIVRTIEKGSVPKKPAQAPCSSCVHQNRCEKTARKLSDLF